MEMEKEAKRAKESQEGRATVETIED